MTTELPFIPDIRPCAVCGDGVLCDEGYPTWVIVVHPDCARGTRGSYAVAR